MTVTITATPQPENSPPRMRLDVTTDQSSLVLWRVAQDGTRTLVRTYDGGPLPVTGSTVTLYDPEPPLGLPVHYTADGTGVTNSAVVTVDHTRVWLVHPGIPALSKPVRVSEFGPRQRQANQSARYPLGRQFPIVATDGRRKAPSYDVVLRTETLEELASMAELLADQAPLLLQVPASLGWGLVSEYVAVGAVTESRVIDWAGHPWRYWNLPCTVVARPPGGSRADVTYGTSYAAYPTYADRYAAHATYREALDP